MDRKHLISFFQNNVKKWYKKHGRKFPWRENSATCFERVISEILLQRTRAETVSNYYSDFFSRFPSWKSIVAVTRGEIEIFLKPIGLWRQRASALIGLASELEKVNYVLPETQEELEALPGIGQYIANAALMFCHGEKKPLLDTNMARVLERFFGKRKMADIRYDPYLQELSHHVVSTGNPAKLNWGILDLAALICRKEPECIQCPLQSNCCYKQDYKNWKNTDGR